MSKYCYLLEDDISAIHSSALRVLSEIGVHVEHEELRKKLLEVGGSCDSSSEVWKIDPDTVECCIQNGRKNKLNVSSVNVSSRVGIFGSKFLNPVNDKLEKFDEESLKKYVHIAKDLVDPSEIRILGLPYIPREMRAAEVLPLAEKLYAWKYGIQPVGGIQRTELCEPILDLFTCHAQYCDMPLAEVFRGVAFMISPLRLAKYECEQVFFFYRKGLKVKTSHLPTQGGSTPVSFGGSIVLALAEQIFLYLLDRALWENVEFSLKSTVATLEFSRGRFCYGRPEMQKINMAFADLARFYGCQLWCHTGLTDAHLPSAEAAVQKVIGAMTVATSSGESSISAGLLSLDEICSPVQLVVDVDSARAIQEIYSKPIIDKNELGVEEILNVGIGGYHLGTDYTFDRFREMFQARTWTTEDYENCSSNGRLTDILRAKEFLVQHYESFEEQTFITSEEERDLRRIINKAEEIYYI